jgi:hypothetical protein
MNETSGFIHHTHRRCRVLGNFALDPEPGIEIELTCTRRIGFGTETEFRVENRWHWQTDRIG